MAEDKKPTHLSNKAKISRRVIEVLEYFDDAHPEATVMDIVRRYDRPQSSTSELLSSLVELGLLQKDHVARTYRPTPRAAFIGTAGQPEFVRDGRIVRLIDSIVERTGFSVALTAMVGLDTQIVHWCHGPQAMASTRELSSGLKQPVHHSSAGLIMLSTFERRRLEGMLHRLNAEAEEAHKFQPSVFLTKINEAVDRRCAIGPIGYGSNANAFSALVPRQPNGRPMALSIVYGRDELVDMNSLLQATSEAMRANLPDPAPLDILERFSFAA